jgi:hypothetical protein
MPVVTCAEEQTQAGSLDSILQDGLVLEDLEVRAICNRRIGELLDAPWKISSEHREGNSSTGCNRSPQAKKVQKSKTRQAVEEALAGEGAPGRTLVVTVNRQARYLALRFRRHRPRHAPIGRGNVKISPEIEIDR